jgi:GntR family transcriptional regulator
MTIHWSGDAPIYIQLYQQVIQRILDGNIQEGEALPSVRKVAAEYQLNPVTISKAYQMLQDEQYVEKQRGKGLFVKPGAPHRILENERTSFLANEWPLILQKISRLKLSIEELPRTIKRNK